MGRKTQITKEEMLSAGLKMIIKGSYSDLTIKTLACEIGCSTQPIAWSFGSIDDYRKELRLYAIKYMQNKMSGEGSITKEHGIAGYAYVDMAIDEPHLIRYLRNDEKTLKENGGIAYIFDKKRNNERRKGWAEHFDISEEKAERYMSFIVTFCEGLVSMILSGVIEPDRENAYKRITEAATAFVVYLKSDLS